MTFAFNLVFLKGRWSLQLAAIGAKYNDYYLLIWCNSFDPKCCAHLPAKNKSHSEKKDTYVLLCKLDSFYALSKLEANLKASKIKYKVITNQPSDIGSFSFNDAFVRIQPSFNQSCNY